MQEYERRLYYCIKSTRQEALSILPQNMFGQEASADSGVDQPMGLLLSANMSAEQMVGAALQCL